MSKILFAASEAHPLIKTGGLADVSGSLPAALKRLRQAVRLVIPAYPQAKQRAGDLKPVGSIRLPGSTQVMTVLEGRMPGSGVIVWLLDYPPAFGREGNPYVGPDGRDWPDNAERFALFCRGVVAIAQDRAGLDWRADVVHCNDWQTGLVPALLSLETVRPATVFTIHNLSYQGIFPAETFVRLGLPHELWHYRGLEFFNHLSFIKGGLVYADRLSTVSPTYAREIQTPEFGYGLDGLLRHRAEALRGILNGIDLQEWDPAHDPHIPCHYDAEHLTAKRGNKRALQEELGLPASDQLLLGSVGRLVEQKGVDLVIACIDRLLELPLQLAVVGSGDPAFEQALQEAAERHPHKMSLRLGYDEGLAHRVEAGADAFLMPSRFEPCGLNQLYSLRYGTPPIVHAVGGLADTVVDASPEALKEKRATGFCFYYASPEVLFHSVERALALYEKPALWEQLARTGMAQVFDWRSSARQYLQLYEEAQAAARQTGAGLAHPPA